MRILGLDFGSKRVGAAVSDELGITAQPVAVIEYSALRECIAGVRTLIDRFQPSLIVVGLPKNMDGSLGKSAKNVLSFCDALRGEFNLPVETWDERLSTAEAEKLLIRGGLSRRKRKAAVDKLSASLILEGYLESMGISFCAT